MVAFRSAWAWAAVLAIALAGCAGRKGFRGPPSPAEAGVNSNNLIDPVQQAALARNAGFDEFYQLVKQVREQNRPAVMPPKRTVLCLSGGGSYGAYTAGVLCGWTQCGGRPQFDVVTGISTGALIAPFAFLGCRYDPLVREFYTTLSRKDILKPRPVRGLFSEAFADNAPLANQIDRVLTDEVVREIAVEHAKGRRLYVGTTEVESRRFVVWDLGAIASRGRPCDRATIKRVLLGSSAIPGVFPPAEIEVEAGGRVFVERHSDGGVSQGLFYAPPHVPPKLAAVPEGRSLYGSDVYAIVAGKLYSDPQVIRPRALALAASNVETVLYAQTRGDLFRLWTYSTVRGMNFHMTAIPAAFPVEGGSVDFDTRAMTALFNEGVRQVCERTAWRTTPPGLEPGEHPLVRGGTNLIYEPRSADPEPMEEPGLFRRRR
ncbi:patatin : Patatin OS=Burkholderia phymatum (strain DSM 17167 / STM815) GN=Bphy_6656 PE=4 SV=1: Patatin [Gemmataceae bacterium]|nr:patatin : Patatin OS=Burkholderia phymatum (strain DSM 17167 / STM815) GN=Bphy_6656 PE=4 SV=1: Patatin [Gemmataceae bacterium]VTU00332.1 patatin : Patatin OS=Burkholderia phymatum (strain DSM 17167 / STM815) GN=Bphy_6656 PE=4 SV=1: Patatin [Gemmataceae bacterium]